MFHTCLASSPDQVANHAQHLNQCGQPGSTKVTNAHASLPGGTVEVCPSELLDWFKQLCSGIHDSVKKPHKKLSP